MKLSKITAAVAALTVSGAASAFGPGTVHDVNMFISGASAQDKAIGALVTSMCDTTLSPIDHYASTNTKHYNAWSCTMTSTTVPGLGVASAKVLIAKRSAGGSGMGVDPVMNSRFIDTIDINACTAPTPAAPHEYTACGLNTVAAGGGQIPDMGVSDVNPELFTGENTPSGFTAVNANDVKAKLVVKPAAALVFGIPVTTDLRDALQVLQFGTASNCAQGPDGTVTAPNTTRETEACMPSLSRNEVATLMTGQIQTWGQFSHGGKSITDPANYAGATPAINIPADTKVTICRRTNGSGTQAQMSANFLRYPCSSAAMKPAHNSFFGSFTGPVVLENSGSGDVNKCLDDFNNGTNNGKNIEFGTGSALANNSGLIKRWALGLQSLEKNADLSLGYRFVKIDGAAPTLQNAANGTYLDWVEQSFQTRKTTAGAKLALFNQIVKQAATPAFLGTLDAAKFNYPFGQSGFLAVSTNGHTPTYTAAGLLDETVPVVPYTHAPGISSLDNCRVPVVNTDAPVSGNSVLGTL